MALVEETGLCEDRILTKLIYMSLNVLELRDWWKNPEQVVEEDHFEWILEMFEITTEAASDWGVVWRRADCCW